MAEEKKTVHLGKDLSSKIATAYRSIPPEERQKTVHSSDEVENPELDRAFDKLVETYRPKRGERAVVPFPRSAAPPAEDTESDAEGEGFECAECGHMNPEANKFCGMCGAGQPEGQSHGQAPAIEESLPSGLGTEEARVRHHHHYYHHHHYRNNPYLLVGIMLLLAVIGWQQYREWRSSRPMMPPVSAPPAQVQPAQPTAPAVVNPTPAVTSADGKPAKPATTPAARPPVTSPRSEAEPSSRPSSPALPVPEASSPPLSPLQRFFSGLVPALVPPASITPKTPSATPSPEQATKRVRVSAGVSEARALNRVTPEYPIMAARARITGPVELEAVIGKDGKVKSLEVVSGNPVLASAAVEAVKQWTYQPYLLDGEPIDVGTRITVVFKGR